MKPVNKSMISSRRKYPLFEDAIYNSEGLTTRQWLTIDGPTPALNGTIPSEFGPNARNGNEFVQWFQSVEETASPLRSNSLKTNRFDQDDMHVETNVRLCAANAGESSEEWRLGFTQQVWFKGKNNPDHPTEQIMLFEGSTVGSEWNASNWSVKYDHTTGVVSVGFQVRSLNTLVEINSPPGYNDDQMHHLVTTWDGSQSDVAERKIRLYLDGVLVATSAANVNRGVRDTRSGGSSVEFYLYDRMAFSGNSARSFAGLLNDWVFWRGTATPEQVQRFYTTQNI